LNAEGKRGTGIWGGGKKSQRERKDLLQKRGENQSRRRRSKHPVKALKKVERLREGTRTACRLGERGSVCWKEENQRGAAEERDREDRGCIGGLKRKGNLGGKPIGGEKITFKLTTSVALEGFRETLDRTDSEERGCKRGLGEKSKEKKKNEERPIETSAGKRGEDSHKRKFKKRKKV